MSPRKYPDPDDKTSIAARHCTAETASDVDDVDRALRMFVNHCALWGHRRGWFGKRCKICGVKC